VKDAFVGNASDVQQVKKAGHKEKLKEKEDVKDLKEVLSTREGRRFLWRLLTECKVFSSIWTPSAQIHYFAGRHDLGLWLMAEIENADQEAFLTMLKEKNSD